MDGRTETAQQGVIEAASTIINPINKLEFFEGLHVKKKANELSF